MTQVPFRRIARVVFATGVVASVALIATPVSAHHSVDFESFGCSTATPDPDEPDITPQPTEAPPADDPTPPPQNCMPSEGERIWGTRLIRFASSTDGTRPIKRVALYILSQEEGIPSPNDGRPLMEETFSRDDDLRRYENPFSWDSVEVTPYNGKYKIRVEVDTYPALTGDETHSASNERANLRVDNPPKPMAAPKILAKTQGSVTIEWNGAPEPDVLSYTVYRAVTKTETPPLYGSFQQYAVTASPAFRDTRISPGFHWYSVKVTRRSVISDKGISSQLSEMSAPAEIKSPEEIRKQIRNGGAKAPMRDIPDLRIRRPGFSSSTQGVVDAPFSWKLPVGDAPDGSDAAFGGGSSEGGGGAADPRGPVLPVAVGMFLVSSALAVGRMPY